MSSRHSVSGPIVFHGPRAVSVRSGGSRTSNQVAGGGLARRLLFPFRPISEPLPVIIAANESTSAKGADAAAFKAVNDELYDFLALAVRGFVLPWWSKITPRDKDFPQEIARIISYLVHKLEERLRVANVPLLVAAIVPSLITQHYVDYRSASSKLQSSYATGLHSSSDSLSHVFHSLQPHMAVSPDGTVDANYVRQIVEHIMRACLPPQDWEAETERSIIREIILKIILESAIPRLSQPWFIHKSLLDVLGPPKEIGPTIPTTRGSRLSYDTIVIFFLSAIQTISGFALAAIALVQTSLQAFTEVNARVNQTQHFNDADLASPSVEMLAEILRMRERNATNAIVSISRLLLGPTSPFLNRLIPYILFTNLRPEHLTKVISQSKKVLFPNGYPGPPPVEPTPEEQVLLREQLEKRIFDLLPSLAANVVFGPDLSTQRQTVRGILDPLSSNKCNVHLLVFILDAILVTVFPELAAVPGGSRMGGDTGQDSPVPSPGDGADTFDHNSTPLPTSP